MRKFNLWIIAFFVGQFLALWHKDRTFKNKVQAASGWEKLGVAFQWLFNFNKRLVVEAKNTDVQLRFNELRDFVLSEKDRLSADLLELKEKLPGLARDKATLVLQDLQEDVEDLKQRLLSFTHEIDEKYQLTELVEKLKAEIKDISESFEKGIEKGKDAMPKS